MGVSMTIGSDSSCCAREDMVLVLLVVSAAPGVVVRASELVNRWRGLRWRVEVHCCVCAGPLAASDA